MTHAARGSLVLLAIAVLTFAGLREVTADPCKVDGQACKTNQSCCGKICINSQPPGKRPFGICCTATTCAAGQCGLIDNGSCPNTLNCGSCPSGQVCTANVCETITTSTTVETTSTTSTTILSCPTCAAWLADPCGVDPCQTGCESTVDCEAATAVDACIEGTIGTGVSCCTLGASSCDAVVSVSCSAQGSLCVGS